MAVHVLIRTIVAAAGLAIALSSNNQGKPLKEQFPWYHSSDELRASIQEVARSCEGAEATLTTASKVNTAEAAGEEVQLDVLRIRRPKTKAGIKALFVFGEHARELVTGEAALKLVRELCSDSHGSELASRTLDQGIEFVLVPNANPIGRRQVEQGFYCKRTNEDGVDLNRNWSDEHRDGWRQEGDEMYPGPRGFSEPETQLLKDLVDQERPDVYLSVHSGAYLLGMPFGYSQSRTVADEDAMLQALGPISQKYCGGGCPFGNLAELIHYKNPGCDIDYVYDRLKTPYVFTWEIYIGERWREQYIEEARDRQPGAVFLQNGRQGLRGRAKATLKGDGVEAEEDASDCMYQFNPQSQEESDAVASRWSDAFLDLSLEVSSRKGSTGNVVNHTAAVDVQPVAEVLTGKEQPHEAALTGLARDVQALEDFRF